MARVDRGLHSATNDGRNYCREFLDEAPIHNALRRRLDELWDAGEFEKYLQLRTDIFTLHNEAALLDSRSGSLGPLDDHPRALSELREALDAYSRHRQRGDEIAAAAPLGRSPETAPLADSAFSPEPLLQCLKWLSLNSNVLHRLVALI